MLREALQFKDVADWWRGVFFLAELVSIVSWLIDLLSCSSGACHCVPCLWLLRPLRRGTVSPPALQRDDQWTYIQNVSEEDNFVFSPSYRRR